MDQLLIVTVWKLGNECYHKRCSWKKSKWFLFGIQKQNDINNEGHAETKRKSERRKNKSIVGAKTSEHWKREGLVQSWSPQT